MSDYADAASIVIAFVNLCLAYYIFVYQRQKDISSKEESLSLQEQNIRLQWFKELIVQPNISEINSYYHNLYSIDSKLEVASVDENLKLELSAFVKNESSKLRKQFYDILRAIDIEMYKKVKTNIDQLTDKIVEKLFDPGLNLNDKPTFEREIGSLISYSNNDLIGLIYTYKGNRKSL